jgi:hypothetical protein
MKERSRFSEQWAASNQISLTVYVFTTSRMVNHVQLDSLLYITNVHTTSLKGPCIIMWLSPIQPCLISNPPPPPIPKHNILYVERRTARQAFVPYPAFLSRFFQMVFHQLCLTSLFSRSDTTCRCLYLPTRTFSNLLLMYKNRYWQTY